MKNRIFHNWKLKITSVVCAVVLWIIIYSIADPAASKTMYNVPVNLINTEAITDKNQVYEVLDDTDVVRRIAIHSTRSVIDSITDSDISVEADFSKMKLDGTIELRITSARYNDSITFKPSTDEMKVSVEDRKERYLTLSVDHIGEPKDGYIVGNSKTAQNRISVSGAQSVIESIDKAVAVVNITDTTSDIVAYADIVLLDKEGDEIPRERVDISMKNVSTTVEILATKTVPVVYEMSGEAAEGYFATGEVEGKVTELKIAGKETALTQVTEIVVSGEALSVEGATETVITEVNLEDYLPTGIFILDEQGSERVEVAIPIVPIVEKEYTTLRMGQTQVINVPDGYSVEHILKSADLTIVVRGPEHLVEMLSPADVTGTIDMAAWLELNERTELKDEETLSIKAVYNISEYIQVIDSTPIELIAKKIGE